MSSSEARRTSSSRTASPYVAKSPRTNAVESAILVTLPVGEVRRFESEFLQYLRHKHEGTLAAIADNKWDDEIIGTLDRAIAEFKQMFLGKEDEQRINEAPAKPLEGEENRETVTRFREGTTDRPAES